MTKKEYEDEKKILIDYLFLRISIEDWHGVWDVGVDLARLQDKYDTHRHYLEKK